MRKENLDRYKRFLGPIFIFIIFWSVIYYLGNWDDSIYYFFDNLKEKKLYKKIDAYIIGINKETIFSVLMFLFIKAFDFFMLILIITLAYSLINYLFFEGVTLPLYRPFEFAILKKKIVWTHFISVYAPFLLLFISAYFDRKVEIGNVFSITFPIIVIVFMFIINLKVSEINKERFELELYLQMLASLILFGILIYQSLGQLNIGTVFYALFISYILVGISKGIFLLVRKVIRQDYQAAKIAKDNLDIIEFIPEKDVSPNRSILHPINRFYKNISREEIEEIIEKRLHKSKNERKKARGKLIKDRNKRNLQVSFSLISTALFTFILFFQSNKFDIDRLLIIIILFLLMRLGMRSVEIIIAFYQDVIDRKPKSSDLTGGERLKLAMVSLVEIGLLSAFISVFYRFLLMMPPLESFMSMDVRNTLLFIFKQLSIQMLNVSFDMKVGLFLSIVHVIQVITSFCLIFLAIASYIGLKNEQSEYEVKYKNEEWKLNEVIVFDRENKQTYAKNQEGVYSGDPVIQKQLWIDGIMSTNDFMKYQRAYREWKNWESENLELEKQWKAYGLELANSRKSAFIKAVKEGAKKFLLTYKDLRRKTK